MKKLFPWLIAFGVLIILNRKTVMNWISPVVAKISSKFGERVHPVTKEKHLHNGVDYKLPVGTAIKSPSDGKVILQILDAPGVAGGNQLIILHSNGYKTGYAHLSKFVKNKGDSVKQGDIIALSGDTGRVTGPHLHFTLTDPKGIKVNPEGFIFKA